MAVPHFDIASLRRQLCLGTATEKLVALLHIPKVSGLIIGPEPGPPDRIVSLFSSTFPGIWQNIT